MEENYYGLHGQQIPRNKIPFDFAILKTNDIIQNQEKTRSLIYVEKDTAYYLVTTRPSEFLSTSQLQQNWTKL